MLSVLTVILIFIILILMVFFDRFTTTSNKKKIFAAGDTDNNNNDGLLLLEPPSPSVKFPIIGHLYLLSGYEIPYQAFTDLGKKFGNVIKLELGSVKCVVVNNQKNIREALVTKGHHFDYRPNFARYRNLFCGNKENSLAFCDWSSTQKVRRDMLKSFTFPRAFTDTFSSLDTIIKNSTQELIEIITDLETNTNNTNVHYLKPLLLKSCAKIFLNHFCSENYNWNDKMLNKMILNFDEIFYEVNQGYAADFLPFLMPFHYKKMRSLKIRTQEIREFINNNVIKNKYLHYNPDNDEPKDYLESLIKHVKKNKEKIQKTDDFDWDTALFALEDIIGGHSAIGNFLTKLFGFLVNEREVQEKMFKEIESVVDFGNVVSLSDRNRMVYIEAVIFEGIRLISSPIVPRVANQDSSIGDFKIEQGTVLFLNNFDLCVSKELWQSPEKFMPERFIQNGKLFKPEYFLPFGGGRRSCMGYKLVQLVSFGILAGIIQKFRILPVKNENYKISIGNLAIKENLKFKLEKR